MIVSAIQAAVIEELKTAFPGCIDESEEYLPDALIRVNQETKEKFLLSLTSGTLSFEKPKKMRICKNRISSFCGACLKAVPP